MYTKLENIISKEIATYPTLFEGRTYAESRLLVLRYLFLVLGNGWAWTKDGYLADEEYESGVEFTWRDSDWYADIAPAYNPDEPLIPRPKKYRNLSGEGRGWQPYVPFEGSMIALVPENVQDDWLDGAIEVITALSVWYENTNNLDWNMREMIQKGEDTIPYRAEKLTWIWGKLHQFEKIKLERSI